MAVLESCPKHNMVAYLEKTEGNAEFHEVIDFLTRSSIHHALTVSPVVSTTFVEQFWMSAKSKIINNVRYITAKVAGKPVSISEASIRSDLLFDDADGIDSLPNQAIFDAIQLMGYEGDLTRDHLNHKKTKQPTPSPPHPSEANIEPQSDPSPRPSPTPHIPDSIPEGRKSAKGEPSVHKDPLFDEIPEDTLDNIETEDAQDVGRSRDGVNEEIENADAEVSTEDVLSTDKEKVSTPVHKDPLFDEIPEDTLDNMETEDAQDVGRSRDGVNEEMENADAEVSTEDVLSTDKEKVSTDTPKVSTDGSKVSTDKEKVSTDTPKVSTDGSKVSTDKEKDSTKRTDEGTDDQTKGRRVIQTIQTTQTTTSTMFRDDETIAQVLLNMSQAKAVSREKEKGVELKDVEETERPRPTSTRSLLTLKPLPKIDLKDKGKKKIEKEDESETESEGIPEAEKKFKQLTSDEEMARKIEADRLLDERLQEEEREQFTVEERAKFLHDTIAAQRRFLAQQRSEAIRNKPPTKNQLRNQMMTYLKHVGNFQHSHLKTKKFEEIQALYEKIKRSDEDFIAIGSAEDERMIKEMNEKGIDSSKNESVKEEGKEEEGTKKRKSGHIKMIARKKPRKQSDDDSDDEHRKCLKIVTFEGILDSEIMEKKSVIARLDKVSSPDGDYLVIYRANGNFRAFNYLMEVLHILDRQDLFHLYELMMEQYSEITLEGFELILWGDLKIMMESSTEENDQSDFWSNQQDWKIITWRLYEACGVCILELEDGIVIHMLVERRYPLSKELLQRMLDLGLEVERESSVALDLIRFIKQQIDEE
ncbi:hypothetical protein Tco_0098412 [Tanacetum coccineum]